LEPRDSGDGMIDDFRKLLDLIMSEGLDRIDSLTDEELRKVMVDE
jgi:hypothetical protein